MSKFSNHVWDTSDYIELSDDKYKVFKDQISLLERKLAKAVEQRNSILEDYEEILADEYVVFDIEGTINSLNKELNELGTSEPSELK